MNKPKLLPKPGSVKVYRAVFPYESKMPEEISFEEGDILYVLEQSADGWWNAKCNGKVGLIPYNYVTEKEEVKTPLHDACRRGNLEFLEECLSQGVSATALDSMGNTPLYWAAQAGHVSCLKLLLSHTSAVNSQNQLGDTPLHGAAARGRLDAVEMLLSCGADARLKNKENLTPFDVALDPSIRNCLQLSQISRNSNSVNYAPEEYGDSD